MFLAKSFTVLVELVQKNDAVVNGRPFIPPVQKITGATGKMKATQPDEAPSVTTVMNPTGQDVSLLLIDQRFSPQDQLARFCPVPVGDQRCNPQIPLASLLLLRRTGSCLSLVLLPHQMNQTQMVNILVPCLPYPHR